MQPMYRKILIVSTALVLIAIAVLAVWFMQQRSGSTPQNTNTNSIVNARNTNTNTNGQTSTNTNTTPTNSNSNGAVVPVTDETDRQSLIRLSKLVVDRYGTFSNRNNFENITSLEPYMTESFRRESAEYISERQNSGVPAEYYGITTTALAAEIITYSSEKAATVEVSTRRIETKTGTEQHIFTQRASVRFQSVSGNWKVNSVEWQ